MTPTTKFSSQGFDLDAAATAAGGGGTDDDVVYEIGGGVTNIDIISNSEEDDEVQKEKKKNNDPMEVAENYKAQGNEAFKSRNFDRAYELYTKAIDSTPGMTGPELLDLQRKWQDEQNRQWREKLDKQEEERREAARKKREKNSDKQQQSSTSTSTTTEEDTDNNSKEDQEDQRPATFTPPSHPYGNKLAIYYCNRAAVCLHQSQYDAAVHDCNISLLLNPNYVKALIRRSTAYEHIDSNNNNNMNWGDNNDDGDNNNGNDNDKPSSSYLNKKTDLALQDAKRALEIDPSNTKIRQTVHRLQKIEDERMEQLKTETMGKLKDLGNSILGNFGLSLDNFNATQDPKTGSYSVSFNQK